jgi:WD40 repeat protein
VLRVSGGKQIRVLEGDSNSPIQSLAFSPTEDFLAGGARDGTLYIWRLSDGSRAFDIEGDAGAVRQLVYSDDGEWLLAATPKVLWIWQRGQNKLFLSNANFELWRPGIIPSGTVAVAKRRHVRLQHFLMKAYRPSENHSIGITDVTAPRLCGGFRILMM